MKINRLISLAFSLCLFATLNAQIVINEYSASNLNQFIDENSKYEDWIELYNTSNQTVDLSGWYLSDKESKPEKWQFPTGTNISGNGFLRVWCSGREVYSGNAIHTTFKLSQTKQGEVLTLSDPNLVLQEAIPMELTLLGHSRARASDGASEWMVSTDPSIGASNDSSPMVKGYSKAPLINLVGGFYDTELQIGIIGAEPNATIHYTTDGTHPTVDDPIYNNLIDITETTIIKAIAISSDPEILPGLIDFETYFINETFTLPVLSVAGNEVQDLANGDRELRPFGTMEFFENNEKVSDAYGEMNSHGQDSWALNHRSLDWIARDEMGYSAVLKGKMFKFSDRDEFQRVMMRASGDDNYPAINDWAHQGSCHIRDEYVHTLVQEGNMKCDVRGVRRMIVFLDGNYWGVYGVREKLVDHDYTSYYYDQGKYDLQYLTTWGFTEADYGGIGAYNDWETLRDFILNNDMSDSTNYELVKDELNVVSLMDYMIANLNTVASDWLNYNTGWWRGTNPDGDHKKWGYIMWGLDATFDYYINYSGVPNTDPDAVPCDIDDIANFMENWFGGSDVGQHEKIFLKLQEENDEFRQLYYSRQADLMNTVFSCENMMTTLNRMLAVIEPEMPRQIDRWGGTMSEWQSNVEDLKDFIEERCQLFDDGMTECFNLTGPYEITLLTVPENVGEIDFNTLDIEEFPYTSSYFGGMDNLIKAKAFDEDEWMFSHWETENGSIIFPDSLNRKAAIRLEGPETLTAHFTEFMVSSSNEIEDQLNFEVFPTLLEKEVNVQFELEESAEVKIDLINLTGQAVVQLTKGFEHFANGSQSHNYQLDVDLAPGIYFVRLFTSNDQSRSAKVMKVE